MGLHPASRDIRTSAGRYLSLVHDGASFAIMSARGLSPIRARQTGADVAGRRDERFDTALALKLEEGEGTARNVSASGIYFVTGAALKEGQRVKFRLDFQNFPGGPVAVACIARVVRVEPEGPMHGVGAAIDSFEFFRTPKKRH